MKDIDDDMPSDAVLIRADLIKVGDRVRFRMPSVDYTVEAVEIDGIGNVRHRAGKPATMTCSYRPGELLWITRRPVTPKTFEVREALQLCYEYLDGIPESAAGGDDEAVRLARIAKNALNSI